MNRKPKIGLLTGGYFEYWKMYSGLDKIVEKQMQKLAEDLGGKIDVVWSGLADTVEKAEAAGRKFREEDVDLCVICEGTYFPDFMPVQALQHIPRVPVLLLLTQPCDHVPLDMDYEQSTYHDFGSVGIVQLSGAFKKMGKKFEIIAAPLDDDALCDRVAQYAEVVLAVRKMGFINIGIVGHTFQGMYDLEIDKTKLKARLGPNVIYIEVSELMSIWRSIKEDEAETVADNLLANYRAEGPERSDVMCACRLGLAMEKLAARHNLSGIAHLCQHLIHVESGTTPCYPASRLTEKGVMVTCEGDIGNLAAMCLVHLLTGDLATFVEWGMYDVPNNALFLAHHGAGSPRLAKSIEDVTLTPTGEKWGFKGSGASWRYMGKPGRVTIASVIDDKDGWKMLISGGESLDLPVRPYWGQQFMVKVEQPVQEYMEALCREGVTHHAILSYGDLSTSLHYAAELLDIRKVVL